MYHHENELSEADIVNLLKNTFLSPFHVTSQIEGTEAVLFIRFVSTLQKDDVVGSLLRRQSRRDGLIVDSNAPPSPAMMFAGDVLPGSRNWKT